MATMLNHLIILILFTIKLYSGHILTEFIVSHCRVHFKIDREKPVSRLWFDLSPSYKQTVRISGDRDDNEETRMASQYPVIMGWKWASVGSIAPVPVSLRLFPRVFSWPEEFIDSVSQLSAKSSLRVNTPTPDSKVHGANMGPIRGRQDPGGPHVGPMNLAIWDVPQVHITHHDFGVSNDKLSLILCDFFLGFCY